MDLEKVFEKYNDEYLKFELVENKLHSRPDVCAFLLLDKLVGKSDRDIIAGAGYDEIFLDIDCRELAKKVTDEDVRTLARCGVRYDEGLDSLAMYV